MVLMILSTSKALLFIIFCLPLHLTSQISRNCLSSMRAKCLGGRVTDGGQLTPGLDQSPTDTPQPAGGQELRQSWGKAPGPSPISGARDSPHENKAGDIQAKDTGETAEKIPLCPGPAPKAGGESTHPMESLSLPTAQLPTIPPRAHALGPTSLTYLMAF